jgi:hypothetical protein
MAVATGTSRAAIRAPLVKVSAVPMSKVLVAPDGVSLELGITPSPVPEPFAGLLKGHIINRPNLRTAGADNPWLFPGYRPGEHLHPNTLMDRLRWLGIDLLGARNTALPELVTQVPPPVVAEMLGYSDQAVHRHANLIAQPWGRYRRPADSPEGGLE